MPDDEVWPHSLRVSSDEWQAFRQLQQHLQSRSPYGVVSLRETFRVCVGSTAAALARGEMPAPDLPREAPRGNPTT